LHDKHNHAHKTNTLQTPAIISVWIHHITFEKKPKQGHRIQFEALSVAIPWKRRSLHVLRALSVTHILVLSFAVVAIEKKHIQLLLQ
jgi:hypothetical protein